MICWTSFPNVCICSVRIIDQFIVLDICGCGLRALLFVSFEVSLIQSSGLNKDMKQTVLSFTFTQMNIALQCFKRFSVLVSSSSKFRQELGFCISNLWMYERVAWYFNYETPKCDAILILCNMLILYDDYTVNSVFKILILRFMITQFWYNA